MAKKSLKPPSLMAPGARRDFFTAVQDLTLRSGDLSTAEIASRTGYSHHGIYLALTGPRVPSWRITTAIMTALGLPADTIRTAWERAVAEQRTAPVPTPSRAEISEPGPTSPTDDCAPGTPGLTPTEAHVLVTWLRAETNKPVLHELGIRATTLHAYLGRIRSKYASAGRPAPTKHLLLVRALQDRLMRLEDFA